MSRAQIASRYSKILTEWPVDRLRPQIQFQTILKKRVQAAPASTPNEQNTAQIQSTKSTRSSELQEVTALSSLLDKHYSRRFGIPPAMMKPLSAPEHYDNLAREIEEAPDRSWFGNLQKRIAGMVRWQ